jgi:RNA polymerase sigma-70 factor, ECF subfamily
MLVFELEPKVNAINVRPVTRGNQGTCDEYSLVAKAKTGQDGAFGELYTRHLHMAYRTALRILRNQEDAEDAVQLGFQRALLNLQGFRGDSTFSTWLTRIVINEALVLLRQRRTRKPIQEEDTGAPEGGRRRGVADGRPTPEQILCESERHAALLRAIGRLRKTLRTVVLHGELQGLTSAQTAERLDLTVSAVKARKFQARRLLRKYLEQRFKRAGARSNLKSSQA